MIAFMVGLVATPLARRVAVRCNIMDRPSDARKVHRDPVPYLGGLGILLGVVAGMAVLLWRNPLEELAALQPLLVVGAGALLIFTVGLADDSRGLRPRTKLFWQLVVASGMWFGGIHVDQVTVGFESSLALDWTSPAGIAASYLITTAWYVVLMNALNLIDGLDGLAGGVSVIGALSIAAITVVVPGAPESILGALLAATTAGAVLGFLKYNWHPASIFLGDAGALLLGFLLASAALLSSAKAATLQSMLIPMVALGLPVFETVYSFLRRVIAGKPPFAADRGHLHHRLLDLGLTQQRAVMILLFATAYFGANSVLLARAGSIVVLMNVLFLGVGMVLFVENLGYLEVKRNGKTNDASGPR